MAGREIDHSGKSKVTEAADFGVNLADQRHWNAVPQSCAASSLETLKSVVKFAALGANFGTLRLFEDELGDGYDAFEKRIDKKISQREQNCADKYYQTPAGKRELEQYPAIRKGPPW